MLLTTKVEIELNFYSGLRAATRKKLIISFKRYVTPHFITGRLNVGCQTIVVD